MRGKAVGSSSLLLSLLLGALLVGCIDEEVVFKERPLFEEPPEGAAEFLGYSDSEAKLTVCGNCHQGMQSGWETTGHADAWAGLQQSGHVQEFCEGCHTVNERGNSTEEEGGWVATSDPRYHDVQCEACHGPGQTHVENPDATQPLANFVVDTAANTGCGECHQGTHQPFVEQWLSSAHGQVPAQPIAAGVGSFCLPCHEGRTALQQVMNETTDYVENQPGSDAGNQPIACVTCHDPHGSGNISNLRAPISVATENHLCVRCHSREGTPSLTDDNVHGPHAFQGLLVLGVDVGWVPPNSDLAAAGKIVSTHGTEANPKLCATCHLPSFEVTDPESGDFVFQSVGHDFNAIPCLDSEGLPTGETDCAVTERTFEACATSGCHGTASAARSAFVTTKTRINNDLDDLWDDVNGDARMDTLSDTGLLVEVLRQDLRAGDADGDGNPVEQINPFDSQFTTAEGALWNAQLAFTHDRPHWGSGSVQGDGRHFGSHKGSGEGVHNPFLLEALLVASKDAVQTTYGVSPDRTLDLTIQAERPPGVSLDLDRND